MGKFLQCHPIVVTMGEPAGVGGEIALKAWAAKRVDTPPFFVLDDAARLRSIADRFGIACPVTTIDTPDMTADAFRSALPVLPLIQKIEAVVTLGAPTAETGASVVGSIEQAVHLVKAGSASALVTNPIHKATLPWKEFPFPGHTEYLGYLASRPSPVMMLAVEGLRVVPVTVHIAIKDVARSLTTEAIVHCGRVTAAALRSYFGIRSPRLAVAALNPHGGEWGRLGDEEARIVLPAISQLKAEGIHVEGPTPADTLFHADARLCFDATLCMYHDQALIPLKTLDFWGGVNITLGLPFVRTSPDHGTACDIAAKGVANPLSLLAALRTAQAMTTHRAKAGVQYGQ